MEAIYNVDMTGFQSTATIILLAVTPGGLTNVFRSLHPKMLDWGTA